MSKFSGKCDFYDEIEQFGIDTILNSKIYVGDSDVQLDITCLADCVPYFPYIVSVCVYQKSTNSGVIRLSKRSWVDIEEERYGKMEMHNVYRNLLEKEIKKAEKERNIYGIESC